jgi:hypothetical protein
MFRVEADEPEVAAVVRRARLTREVAAAQVAARGGAAATPHVVPHHVADQVSVLRRDDARRGPLFGYSSMASATSSGLFGLELHRRLGRRIALGAIEWRRFVQHLAFGRHDAIDEIRRDLVAEVGERRIARRDVERRNAAGPERERQVVRHGLSSKPKRLTWLRTVGNGPTFCVMRSSRNSST